jgi:hypothetical protein
MSGGLVMNKLKLRFEGHTLFLMKKYKGLVINKPKLRFGDTHGKPFVSGAAYPFLRRNIRK